METITCDEIKITDGITDDEKYCISILRIALNEAGYENKYSFNEDNVSAPYLIYKDKGVWILDYRISNEEAEDCLPMCYTAERFTSIYNLGKYLLKMLGIEVPQEFKLSDLYFRIPIGTIVLVFNNNGKEVVIGKIINSIHNTDSGLIEYTVLTDNGELRAALHRKVHHCSTEESNWSYIMTFEDFLEKATFEYVSKQKEKTQRQFDALVKLVSICKYASLYLDNAKLSCQK